MTWQYYVGFVDCEITVKFKKVASAEVNVVSGSVDRREGDAHHIR